MNRILLLVLMSLFFVNGSSENFIGGGSVDVGNHDQVSEFEQMNRLHRYMNDRDKLIQQGKLHIDLSRGIPAMYDFPLATNHSLPSFYGISNFVDLDFNYPNQLQDYTCGDRTYDLDNGYNHGGIDYFTWPFGWHKQDHDVVQVVAAEAGTITTKLDGNYDRVCSFNDPLNTGWNAVYITHADGSYAWYGHLKNGSLTNKPQGATVEVGEYLGVVGSSGNSTGPHLHFETHDFANNVVEPYDGFCNQTTTDSWWRTQKPYHDSKINELMTHSALPEFATCPQTTDSRNDSQNFNPGQRVYLVAYYSDQLENQVTTYQVIRPDGSVGSSWTHSSNEPHYVASYWYWFIDLSASPQLGKWTFKATYESQVVEHNFWVGDLIFADTFD